MARYIDADKADVERISCFYSSECRIEDVQEWLDEQPTADVVEVVRCKDCKNRRETAHGSYCLPVYGLKQITDLNAYCSYGERKEKNDFKE